MKSVLERVREVVVVTRYLGARSLELHYGPGHSFQVKAKVARAGHNDQEFAAGVAHVRKHAGVRGVAGRVAYGDVSEGLYWLMEVDVAVLTKRLLERIAGGAALFCTIVCERAHEGLHDVEDSMATVALDDALSAPGLAPLRFRQRNAASLTHAPFDPGDGLAVSG